MADYQLATGGVIRTADSAFIPNDAESSDWQEYQDWLAVPNTPDAAGSMALADYKDLVKGWVDRDAEREMAAHLPPMEGRLAFVYAERLREAIEESADGSPTAAEYPILDAMKTNQGGTISTAGDAVIADWDAVKASLGAIEDVRQKAHDDIDADVSISEVDTTYAAITWP